MTVDLMQQYVNACRLCDQLVADREQASVRFTTLDLQTREMLAKRDDLARRLLEEVRTNR